MLQYIKVYESFFSGTISRESAATRILFQSLILRADKHDVVHGAVDWLAAYAGITKAEAREGLARLSAPDPDSTSQEDDGRRIVPVGPNRWRIANRSKYLAKGAGAKSLAEDPYESKEAEDRRAKRRAYRAEWMRRKRASAGSVEPVDTRVNTREQAVNKGAANSNPATDDPVFTREQACEQREQACEHVNSSQKVHASPAFEPKAPPLLAPVNNSAPQVKVNREYIRSGDVQSLSISPKTLMSRQGFLTDLPEMTVELEKPKSRRKKPAVGPEPTSFAEFWAAYPRRPGNPRVPALAEYVKALAGGVDPELILASAKTYASHCRREAVEPAMVAHARTWLHQARWDDWKQAAPLPPPVAEPIREPVTEAEIRARMAAILHLAGPNTDLTEYKALQAKLPPEIDRAARRRELWG